MAYIGPLLDAALLALEVEIFRENPTLTDNEEFLVRAMSCWSRKQRINTLASLMTEYGRPDLASQIVHALARLICRDVEVQLNSLVREFSHSRG